MWEQSAGMFLVARLDDGPWMRTSGLTDAEKSIFLRSVKEPRSVEFVRAYAQPGMTAIDVGANIGYFTLILAARVGSSGSVHAFEPTGSVVQRLRENVALNALRNVVVNHAAVSSASGSATLNLSSSDAEANSLFGPDPGGRSETVVMTTLDEYASGQRLGPVRFVKIDCEGSETDVIKGAASLLASGPVLMFECNDSTLAASGSSVADLCERIESFSYRLFCLETLATRTEVVRNIVAARDTDAHAMALINRMGLPVFDWRGSRL